MSSDDPFASPQAGLEPEASADPADEAKRRLMLRTETAVRAVGLTYFMLGATVTAVAAAELAQAKISGALLNGALRLSAGVVVILIGYGLRRLSPAARWPAIAASTFGLLQFPLGTAYHLYVLVLLLSPKGRAVLSRDHAALIERTSALRHPPMSWRVAAVFALLLAYLAYSVVERVRAPSRRLPVTEQATPG